ETGDLTGSDAALEVVSWEHADIEIAEGCPLNGPPLPGGLAFLLMEGMRLKDEQERETAEDDIDVLLSAPTAVPPPPPAGDPSEPVREALDRGREVDGALATLLAKVRTGGVVAAAVGSRSVDLEAAAAGAAALIQRKGEVEERMGLREALEELLWTTARHLYLLRPLGAGEELFLLMVLDRRKADLPAAQSALASIAGTLAGRVAA